MLVDTRPPITPCNEQVSTATEKCPNVPLFFVVFCMQRVDAPAILAHQQNEYTAKETVSTQTEIQKKEKGPFILHNNLLGFGASTVMFVK